MKFSFGRGGGQISLNQKISQNKVSYIGLKYLILDGRVQNPKFLFLITPYLEFKFTFSEITSENWLTIFLLLFEITGNSSLKY